MEQISVRGLFSLYFYNSVNLYPCRTILFAFIINQKDTDVTVYKPMCKGWHSICMYNLWDVLRWNKSLNMWKSSITHSHLSSSVRLTTPGLFLFILMTHRHGDIYLKLVHLINFHFIIPQSLFCTSAVC